MSAQASSGPDHRQRSDERASAVKYGQSDQGHHPKDRYATAANNEDETLNVVNAAYHRSGKSSGSGGKANESAEGSSQNKSMLLSR